MPPRGRLTKTSSTRTVIPQLARHLSRVFLKLLWSVRLDKGSPAFEEFLDFLGARIKLEGWTKFRGGLDVSRKRPLSFLLRIVLHSITDVLVLFGR